MALTIVRHDITKMKVDVIVNPSNMFLDPGVRDRSVDATIHNLAGPELDAALKDIGFCPPGHAVITPSFKIQTCKYIIHCVSPVYCGGYNGEDEQLAGCYRTALALAIQNHCKSIAFPSIGTGTNRYPKAEAYRIATSTIRNCLLALDTEMKVYLVLHDSELTEISRKVDGEIDDFIAHKSITNKEQHNPSEDYAAQDRPFADMCEWWMEKKGISIGEFYSRANILRTTFSRLRKDPQIVPKKNTVLACAIGLKLDYDQTQDLLRRAGMTLTDYYETDLIVEYFIHRGNYDIDTLNAELADKKLPLLGASLKY